MDALATVLTTLVASPGQHERLLRLHTPLGPEVLVAERLSGLEAVDAGFRLTGIGGVVVGGAMVAEGISEREISPLYGSAMVVTGGAIFIASVLMFTGFGIPVAIVLMILASIVTVVLAWFKPDEVQRWLDKTLHFGNNASGAFPGLEAQGNAMTALQQG